MKLKLLLVFIIPVFSFSQSIATYTIEFTGTWNSGHHGTLPDNAHWSDLVGATHNSNITFWEAGMLASTGIENVAEIGSNTALNNEVNAEIPNAEIPNGNADQWLQQAFNSPNIATSSATLVNIEISENFPLLTLVSMIAPSPDWFIGINSFSLLDGSENWKDNISIDMFPYDAGTENGNGYSTSNAATNPQQTISSRRNITPFNDPKVGILTITLQSVLSTNNFNDTPKISVFPNPTKNIVNLSNLPNTNNLIKIYDILGKEVLRITTNNRNETIDVSSLKSGIYIIKIESNKQQVASKKLVIN
jgi:hypothetical protein